MDNPVVISALLALTVALLIYALFMPRNVESFAPDNEEQAEDNFALRLTTKISTEFYATLPAASVRADKRNRGNPRLESLIIRSGNPWGLKAQEFNFFQITTGILGFIIGWVAWLILFPLTGLHWAIVVGFCTIVGTFLPRLKYNDAAKRRDLEFKRHLPEALDLIIISLSAGNTFTQAVRESINNMPAGVLREEFRDMVRSIDTGKTLHDALTDFASRAPNENISTFVRAVQEATELDVPLIETLESRAQASRQEFFSMLHGKTAALPEKMMGVIAPTLVPAVLIVLMAPSIMSLVNSFALG